MAPNQSFRCVCVSLYLWSTRPTSNHLFQQQPKILTLLAPSSPSIIYFWTHKWPAINHSACNTSRPIWYNLKWTGAPPNFSLMLPQYNKKQTKPLNFFSFSPIFILLIGIFFTIFNTWTAHDLFIFGRIRWLMYEILKSMDECEWEELTTIFLWMTGQTYFWWSRVPGKFCSVINC